MVGSLRVVHLFEESRRSAVVVYHSARGWLRLVNCSSKCSDRNHAHERYCCSDPEGQGDRRSDEQGRHECSQSESSHDKTLQPHFETIASRRWERLRGTIAGTPRDYDLKASLQARSNRLAVRTGRTNWLRSLGSHRLHVVHNIETQAGPSHPATRAGTARHPQVCRSIVGARPAE